MELSDRHGNKLVLHDDTADGTLMLDVLKAYEDGEKLAEPKYLASFELDEDEKYALIHGLIKMVREQI